jgi:hypothetical protein
MARETITDMGRFRGTLYISARRSAGVYQAEKKEWMGTMKVE